jgi:UDP-N-acetyl-D-galactosamine dehydrogenase
VTNTTPRICVVGLGYVGLPLAVALAKSFETVGLDIDQGRIAELRDGHDRTGEIDADRLRATTLRLTADPAECKGYDAYIVTVPTPVDRLRRPDLGPVMSATRTVAGLIAKGSKALVVYAVRNSSASAISSAAPTSCSAIRRSASIPATANIPSIVSPR